MSNHHCEDITLVKKILFGNGMTGLINKVEQNQKYISEQIGTFRAIKWLLGFIGFGELVLILNAFAPKLF